MKINEQPSTKQRNCDKNKLDLEIINYYKHAQTLLTIKKISIVIAL